MTTIKANRADAVAAAGHLLKAHQLLLDNDTTSVSDTTLDLACQHLAELLGGSGHFAEADELMSEAIDPNIVLLLT